MVSLIYLFSIVLLTSFIGFGFTLVCYDGNFLKRILLSPVIGYATVCILTANFSYLGFSTNQIALPLFSALLLAATALFITKHKHIKFNKSDWRLFLPIIIFALINSIIVLAPTLIDRAPYLFNDHTTYISIAEYLRDFSFFTPTHQETSFWHNNTWIYQTEHYRMGAQFFVSFLAALFQTTHTLNIYPAIIGFLAYIFMTTISFFYVTLRNNYTNILECIFVLFFSLIAINLNSQNIALGFLPQTFGLTLFIALSALIYTNFHQKEKNSILIGIFFAALILTYHELTLFYGLGIFIVFVYQVFQKNSASYQTLLRLIIVHILALIVSPIATREFLLGIISSSEANNVGWHISYSLVRYYLDILGQDIHYQLDNNWQRFITLPGVFGSFIFIYFLLKKSFWQDKKETFLFWGLFFLPFVLAICFYAFFKLDPFNYEIGHTWRIFKLVSWSYWIIPIFIGLTTFSYYQHNRQNKVMCIILIALLLPAVGGNIYANYLSGKQEIEIYTNNYLAPLNDFEYLAIHKNEYSPANIIDYESHPNYPYLILSLLKNTSVGDLNLYGFKLKPSTEENFFQWVNYRREHANTSTPQNTKAGFFIYPKGSSTVYLADGFDQHETVNQDHLAWLIKNNGIIKVIVPKHKKAQFHSEISNWQTVSAPIEITLNNQTVFSQTINNNSSQFISPILTEGLYEFHINYKGTLHVPDSKEKRTLALMFKNTTITSIQ